MSNVMIKANWSFLLLLVLAYRPLAVSVDSPRAPSGGDLSVLEVESGGNLIRREFPLRPDGIAQPQGQHDLQSDALLQQASRQKLPGDKAVVIGGKDISPENADLEKLSRDLTEGIDALDAGKKDQTCCQAQTASCLACLAGKSILDFCADPSNQIVEGCTASAAIRAAKESGSAPLQQLKSGTDPPWDMEALADCGANAIEACLEKLADGATASSLESQVDTCASAQSFASCIKQLGCCAKAAGQMREKLKLAAANASCNVTDPCPDVEAHADLPHPGKCHDVDIAPRGRWVVYNESHAVPAVCRALSVGKSAPEPCCAGVGAVDLVGAKFSELHSSNLNSSCPVLPLGGPFAGHRVKLQCNADKSVTFGAGECGANCSSCKTEHHLPAGCYKGSDFPGTTTFIKSEGCACPPPVTAIIMLLGDYSTVVGLRKEDFLRECSVLLAPKITCVDVQPGSILLTLGAKSQFFLDEVLSRIHTDGLHIPSFRNLMAEVKATSVLNQTSKDFVWSDKNKECLNMDAAFAPIDMPGTSRSQEHNYMKCRERCHTVAGCAHWSFYILNGGCHLQDANANQVDLQNVLTGIPNCLEKDPFKHGGVMKAGGQSCYQMSVAYIPLDLPNTSRFHETSYDGCQARCVENRNCVFFTYFLASHGCHIQGGKAHRVWLPGTISGKPTCNATEKDQFDTYLHSLPMTALPGQSWSGQWSADRVGVPCEDALAPFVLSDLDDLDEPGDLSAHSEVRCSDLALRKERAEICIYSERVKQRCPKMCGKCDIETDDGGCVDGNKNVPPLFWLDDATLPCSSVKYACQHDEEVDRKCKDSCGWCNLTTTSTPTTSSTTAEWWNQPHWLDTKIAQVMGCSRRRGMGYCFSRRRRLF